MAPVARIPLADQALAVLGSALRDPNVVLRYQAKIVTVPDTKEPDISARRSMNSSDWRFVPAAAPRCATLPTNCPPRSWPHYSASQSTPPAGGPHSSNETGRGYIAERDGQPLGTRADVTDTGGRSSLRRAVVGTNHPSWVLRLPPLTGHFRGRVLWESPSQVRRSSPTRANFSAEGSPCDAPF